MCPHPVPLPGPTWETGDPVYLLKESGYEERYHTLCTKCDGLLEINAPPDRVIECPACGFAVFPDMLFATMLIKERKVETSGMLTN